MWHSLLLLIVLNICCSLTDWCYVFLLQELLFPCIELGKQLKLLVDWEDPFKSHAVLVLILFIVYRYCNLFWQADTPLALNYSKLKFCKSLILCDEYDLTRVIYMTPSERNWSEWKSMLRQQLHRALLLMFDSFMQVWISVYFSSFSILIRHVPRLLLEVGSGTSCLAYSSLVPLSCCGRSITIMGSR